MKLFNQLRERFGEREIAGLTAEREFIGIDWFGYLDPLTPLRIRIRENHKLRHGCHSSQSQCSVSGFTGRAAQSSTP